ncbi:molybdenum cofactor guanylyltransferase [Enterococcus crotali]|uniref:molybdenum cofactor guanylyltransferase n=1 Tax=Enterococcus crotali TaxID=1453587 RepID=UPI0023BAE46F|nr:molybdenum cofactor guanylyltransferase [Enterococcus crotali]
MCGGKSSRMGFDKSLLQVDGEYMLLRSVAQLKRIFSNVLLVTNKQSKFPAIFSQVEILEDHYSEKGPLGGLVTALETVKTQHLFLLACDIPNLNSTLIQRMANYCEAYDVVICEQDKRLEPLFAFYRTTCLPVLQPQLVTNDWRIRKEFDQLLVKVVALDSSFILKNVNTPMELVWWNQ